MAKDKAVSVRVEDDVKAALEQAAVQDDRTVAAYVERLIIDHLVKKGLLKAKPRTLRRRS